MSTRAYTLFPYTPLFRAAEGRDQLVALGGQLGLLAADLHFLEPRELAQPGLEDVVGLLLAELEALHEDGLGLVLAADDADHLVEVEERDRKSTRLNSSH